MYRSIPSAYTQVVVLLSKVNKPSEDTQKYLTSFKEIHKQFKTRDNFPFLNSDNMHKTFYLHVYILYITMTITLYPCKVTTYTIAGQALNSRGVLQDQKTH